MKLNLRINGNFSEINIFGKFKLKNKRNFSKNGSISKNNSVYILINAINNIIFLCSEMTSCLINDDENNINFYVEKIQKYSNYKL